MLPHLPLISMRLLKVLAVPPRLKILPRSPHTLTDVLTCVSSYLSHGHASANHASCEDNARSCSMECSMMLCRQECLEHPVQATWMALLFAKAETPTLFITPQQRKANKAWCLQQPALAVLPYSFKVRTILWLYLCMGHFCWTRPFCKNFPKSMYASHERCKSLIQDALNSGGVENLEIIHCHKEQTCCDRTLQSASGLCKIGAMLFKPNPHVLV